jgi:acetyl/propionyl-CoA carboxylase alpha subunit
MKQTKLFVANRGEIALRIERAAAQLGIPSVAVYAEDDTTSLHVRGANEAYALRGSGARAYLDIEQILEAAVGSGCGVLHPGYGFLSENAEFARQCEAAGVRFAGPAAATLELLGDKVRARAQATACDVPVLAGTDSAADPRERQEFLASLPAGSGVMVKAVAGGGGRGMRVARTPEELEAAVERCRSEARAAFGDDALYLEEYLPHAKHLEVQIAGDGDRVVHLGERECSVQRNHQKLIEVAPSPGLNPALREELCDAALRIAASVNYRSLGTFEFLVDYSGDMAGRFAFIEANPRLQVEHTVTEEVSGIDLVRLQLELAAGRTLTELGLGSPPPMRGHAIQMRVNMERMQPDGSVRPSGGTLTAFAPPSGPGIRCDTFGYAGYTTSPNYDSLLAKVIAHASTSSFEDAVALGYRALCEFQIEGVETNLSFLQALLQHPDFVDNRITTAFVEKRISDLLDTAHPRLYVSQTAPAATGAAGLAGAQLDTDDPLAVLEHGKSERDGGAQKPAAKSPEGTLPTRAPMQGTIVSLSVAEGDEVYVGQALLVMESMKMEHVIGAECSGVVRRVEVAAGDAVFEGHDLVSIERAEVAVRSDGSEERVDLDRIRPDLAEVVERHAVGLDKARPESVERRRRTGQRTARENVDDLCDPGTFVEYGPMVIAAQRRRRSVEDLIEHTPADGMVAGIGRVNGADFGEKDSRCIVISYDYTVLAGTQGQQNHRKKDRMFELAEQWELPIVFLTEGGGGRPGDTDGLSLIGLDVLAFNYFAKLSGLVPLVAINSGYCFAGNAAKHRDGWARDDRRRWPRRLPARRSRADGGPGAQRRRGYRGRGRSRGRVGGKEVSLLLPGLDRRLGMRRPTSAAQRDSGEPPAGLRRTAGDRDPRRHRLGTRAAPRVWARHGHRAGADRRPADRDRGQQPDPSRRRD